MRRGCAEAVRNRECAESTSVKDKDFGQDQDSEETVNWWAGNTQTKRKRGRKRVTDLR